MASVECRRCRLRFSRCPRLENAVLKSCMFFSLCVCMPAFAIWLPGCFKLRLLPKERRTSKDALLQRSRCVQRKCSFPLLIYSMLLLYSMRLGSWLCVVARNHSGRCSREGASLKANFLISLQNDSHRERERERGRGGASRGDRFNGDEALIIK